MPQNWVERFVSKNLPPPAEPRREYGSGSVISKPTLKNWYIAFYRDGKQIFMNTKFPKTEENRDAAENLLKQELAKITLDIPSDAVGLASIKYETIRENLIEEFRRDKVSSIYEKKNADGTVTYSGAGLNWLDEYFKGQTLKEMADRIAKYPAWVQKQKAVQAAHARRRHSELTEALHQGASEKNAQTSAVRVADAARDATINRSLATLRSMYSRYSKSFPKKLSKNDIPYMPRIANADNVRQGFCNYENFDKIYNRLPEHLKPFVLFLYYTGMRSGMASKITWDMVEFDAKKRPVAIRIPGFAMKNRAAWEIPLVGPLVEISDTLAKMFHEANAPVFDTTNMRRTWNTICHNLGFGVFNKSTHTYHGLHPHDFRRSAAKNMMEAGLDEAVAMSITGHKSPSMFRRYNIVSPERKKSGLEAVAAHRKAVQG
jgi:integrase